MKKRPAVPAIIFFSLFLSTTGFTAQFQLAGWEYETRLSNARAEDTHFIETVPSPGSDGVLVFYKNARQLVCSRVSGGVVAETRELFGIDPFSQPVIRYYENQVYILSCYGDKYTLYRMKAPDRTEAVYSFQSAVHFNPDLFPNPNGFLVTVPFYSNNQYSIRTILLEKNGLAFRAKTADLRPSDPTDKGFFFLKVFPWKGSYRIFLIRRFYEEARKVIRDSILTAGLDDLSRIGDLRPSLLVPFGYSDHAPEIFSYRDELYYLFARKRNATYSLKVIPEKSRLEYTVSRESIDSFSAGYFLRDASMDLFYLGKNGNLLQIYYRGIALDSLETSAGPSVPGNAPADRVVTVPDTRIGSLSVCTNGNVRYIFFIGENDRQIYFTRSDFTGPAVLVQSDFKTSLSKRFPLFNWKTPVDPSGIGGYAYVIDGYSNTEPVSVNLAPQERFLQVNALPLGKYYLHIRAYDGIGNAGPVFHTGFSVTPTGTSALEKKAAAWDFSTIRNGVLPGSEESFLVFPGEKDAVSVEAALSYYFDGIERSLSDGNVVLAKQFLNRVILIAPEKMETALFLQEIRKKESGTGIRDPILLASIVTGSLILVLTALYGGLNRI